ncbi:hypothetical protein M3N64_05450 [Sporolactobacillus sp. CPB3-1]|uniref:ABC transporter permease n=1 Tax=Sporolactobacillus mangiferae TaxID=2940498 RepID=A0ABT0M950_9BACL|nr:hypothetical protein [Sporolactobacillus mangiferae]MCL1631397.1 hypothetical protein [Sporolactobacillus mangiferae]
MREIFFLKVIDWLRPIFERLGVDYPAMRHVLAVKLIMDTRRLPVVLGSRTRTKRKESNLFLKSLWVYALIGLFLIPMNLLPGNYLFRTSLVFGIILFMVMTSMIADFSSVLLDTRDLSILWTKPIRSRTLHAAKTVHICIYLILLTGALGLPSALIGLIKFGPVFFLLFLLNLLFIDLTAVSCTTFIYLIVLKCFDGERLKDMINSVQIFLSIAIAVGYQLVLRAFDGTATQLTFSPAWWQLFVPPLWSGAMIEWLIGSSERTGYMALLGLLGLVIPIILLIVNQAFSTSFEQAIIKLSMQRGKGNMQFSRLSQWTSRLLCRNREERLFFRFASSIIKQDRTFKLKVYPSIGIAFIFPFIFLMNSLSDSSWNQLSKGSGYFYAYFCLIMIPTVLLMLKYSSAYKGAWTYRAAPIQSHTALFSGALKAVFTQLFLPVYLILSIALLFLFKWTILPDLLAVLLTASIYTVICSHYCLDGDLPFSVSFDAAPASGNFIVIFLFLIAGLFAAAHALIRWTFPGFGVPVYCAILFIAGPIVWKKGVART